MSIAIDLEKGTCTVKTQHGQDELPISDITISTDKTLRTSVIRSVVGKSIVTESEVQTLLGAGANDDRENLVYDE
nr:DUF3203 family protein [uncultured Pseudomonas sp.]